MKDCRQAPEVVREFEMDRARIGRLAMGRVGLEAELCEVEQAGGNLLLPPTEAPSADAVESAAMP